jgi:hypothetical protein
MNVEQWISTGKPYKNGLELFKKLGGSQTLLSYFLAGENSLSKRKLQEAIAELTELPKNNTITTEHVALAEPKPIIQEKIRINLAEIPEEVRHIDSLRLESFKKMAALHQAACAISGNGQKAIENRFSLMCQIKELNRTNEECWRLLNYYAEHKCLPPNEDEFNPRTLTIRELVNLEKTIPTYISKEKKKLDKDLSADKKDLVQANIFKLELQLKQVKETIDSLPKAQDIPCS